MESSALNLSKASCCDPAFLVLDWESSSEMMALTPEQIAEYRQEMESHLRSISSIESSVEVSMTLIHSYLVILHCILIYFECNGRSGKHSSHPYLFESSFIS